MRRFWIVVLSLGTVGGFAAGFAHLRHHHQHGHPYFRSALFERHVADLCTDAAARVYEKRARPPADPGP